LRWITCCFFLGRPRRLRLLELELPVVHDLRDRGPRERGDLDQIETAFHGRRERFLDAQHAQLLAVGRDHPDRTDADLPVDPDARRFVVGAFDRQVRFSSSKREKRIPATPESALVSPQLSAVSRQWLIADG